MTLDESIKREQMLTDSNYEMAESCHTDEGVYLKEEGAYRDRAEYHEQLAEWLRELKYYKDRQDLINKSWQELINYKEGVERIKMRSQAYRECGESILASGMEQALDILMEVKADG